MDVPAARLLEKASKPLNFKANPSFTGEK